ncbi:MAG: ferritin-like domain-containing protein [Minicystis sp.]
MSTATTFRRTLAHRLLVLLALPASGAAGGCTSVGTSCPETEPQPTVACFAWPPEDAGAGGAGGGGAGGGGTGTADTCPSPADAAQRLQQQTLSFFEITEPGTLKDGQCCYQAMATPFCEGRPYLVDEVARTAPPVRGHGDEGWSAAEHGAPRTDDLDAAQRATLAAAWTRDALFEHASVASFGRFALELLAVGAPADLVADAHHAALDEVRHARLCFALAGAYAGEVVAPSAFPFEGRVEVVTDLASIAARAVKEGCIGETIAAIFAAERRDAAEDPAVRAALSHIAADEARHAELAWRTVAWAIRAGGARVRDAVEEAFAGLDRGAAPPPGAAPDARLAAHGLLGDEALGGAARRAVAEVVRPAARLLLSAREDVRHVDGAMGAA